MGGSILTGRVKEGGDGRAKIQNRTTCLSREIVQSVTNKIVNPGKIKKGG